jgi:ribosome biogenesis GTPase A
MKFSKTYKVNRPRDIEAIQKQREKYPEIVLKLIEVCDLIIEVIDSRFLEETRNRELEELIKNKGKRILFVLNKTDLIDKNTLVIPKDMKPAILISCKKRERSRVLRERIKKEARYRKEKFQRAQVGIIGYPNSGKSSLINFLIGKNSAKTAHEAGFTKGLQKLRLSSKILLLDTPGVIPSNLYSHTEPDKITHHVKVGARNYDRVKNPELMAFNLTKEYPKEFSRYYNFELKDNFEELVEKIGRERNFILRKGKVDEDRTCRMMIKDWQDGKIKKDI